MISAPRLYPLTREIAGKLEGHYVCNPQDGCLPKKNTWGAQVLVPCVAALLFVRIGLSTSLLPSGGNLRGSVPLQGKVLSQALWLER